MKKTQKTKVFIQKAKLIHGDKYDYSKVDYINNKTKVEIVCPNHGSFLQISRNHLSGHGCPKCGYRTHISTEEIIQKAKNIHGDRYDYSKVVYMDTNTRIKIICSKHGIFEQFPYTHIKGCGCPKCGWENQRISTYNFIQRAKRIHGNKFDYSKVRYIDHKTEIKIICPIYGEFKQIPEYHVTSQHGYTKDLYEQMKKDKLKS